MPFTDLMESIRGWGKSATHDGVRLVGPLPESGTITIHQQVPLRPIAEMLREQAAMMWGPDSKADLGPATLFATCEGEHACLLPVEVHSAAGTSAHWVAVVIGDEHAVIIDATADLELMPATRERVHMIAEYYYLALGETRRRKYEYTPPAGWNGLRLPTATWWFHPGYPRQMAVIKVFDVRPAAVSAPDVLDRVLFIDPTIINDEPPTPPIACRTPKGLMGYIVRGDGTLNGVPVSFASAYFTDERFAYFMRIEARRDIFSASMPAFAALTESIVAIPHTRLKATTTNLIHWTE